MSILFGFGKVQPAKSARGVQGEDWFLIVWGKVTTLPLKWGYNTCSES